MKKYWKKVVLGTIAGVGLFSAVTFAAISSTQAVNIVKANYPGANVYSVEYDHEDGVQVYEVKFTSDKVRKGEVKIDIENGQVIEQSIHYYIR